MNIRTKKDGLVLGEKSSFKMLECLSLVGLIGILTLSLLLKLEPYFVL